MEEPLSQHVEEPLRDLQADSLDKKNRAAEQLGKLSVSSHQIVRALIAAKMCDSSYVIRKTAAESLRAPVHQEILRQNPRLMRSAQLPPDQVLAFQEDDTVPGFDSLSAAIESSLVRLDSWMIGLVYGLVLVGATAFLLKVELNLVVLAAYALVWLVGLFLGQHILRRKGYRKEAEEIVDSWANRFKGAGSGSGELGVVLLAILALFGPFLLLTALLAKPRGSLGQDKEGAVKEIRGFVPVAAACYTRAAYCVWKGARR